MRIVVLVGALLGACIAPAHAADIISQAPPKQDVPAPTVPSSAPPPATPAYSPQLEPMTFRLAAGEGPGGARRWVSATGQIQLDTPARFRQFAAANDLKGLTLLLDSSGGRVMAAMDLGRQVRALGMSTSVGRTVGVNGSDSVRTQDVRCASACVLLLMAGVRRTVVEGARVEVHMFSVELDQAGNKARDEPTFRDIEQTQRTMARHAVYVAEMGVEARYLELMTQASFRGATRRLTMAEMASVKLAEPEKGQAPALPQVWLPGPASAAPQLLRAARLVDTPQRRIDHELVIECDTVRNFYWVTYRQQVTKSEAANPNVGVMTARLVTGGWDFVFRAPNNRPLMIAREGGDLWMRRSVPARVLEDAAANRRLTVELSGPNLPRQAELFEGGLAEHLPALKRRCDARPGLVSVGGNPRR